VDNLLINILPGILSTFFLNFVENIVYISVYYFEKSSNCAIYNGRFFMVDKKLFFHKTILKEIFSIK